MSLKGAESGSVLPSFLFHVSGSPGGGGEAVPHLPNPQGLSESMSNQKDDLLKC